MGDLMGCCGEERKEEKYHVSPSTSTLILFVCSCFSFLFLDNPEFLSFFFFQRNSELTVSAESILNDSVTKGGLLWYVSFCTWRLASDLGSCLAPGPPDTFLTDFDRTG